MTTILVVDDEYGIAEVLEGALAQRGYRVVSAHNGKQGLDVALRETPDLAIIDLMMPVMSGAELIAALRAHDGTRDMPVIVMSSLQEGATAIPAPYSGYLRKPFRIRDLAALLDGILRRA
jgi:DNA-binding response OmpR family regulator